MIDSTPQGHDPAFLLYSADFLIGVSDLTMEERGQYITLLCTQHQKGRLTNKQIAITVPQCSPDVLAKFTIDIDGKYYNQRLEFEAERRTNFINRQRENGAKGGRPKNPNANPNKTHGITHGETHGESQTKPKPKPIKENENENENNITINTLDIEFHAFWDLYAKKVDRKRCYTKWKNLKRKDVPLIFARLPAYLKATPDIKYRKNPLTYLNGESWNDEIVGNNTQQKKQTFK